MPDQHFEFYKKFLFDKSGLDLRKEKLYLLDARLTPISKKWQFESLEDMTNSLINAPDTNMEWEVIDAMTTNETLFFRDDKPFNYLKSTIIPQLEKSHSIGRKIRIWSAACSTGQEPYSIIMSFLETLGNPTNWNIHVLGTDLSDSAMAQARKGEFNQFEIQRGLPIQLLMKYFTQDGSTWKIQDNIKNMVTYEKFNLLDCMEKHGKFDIIFCRNVLIYFDSETKKKILNAIIKQMAPDGFLFLGGAETVLNLCPELKTTRECPGLYTLQEQTPSAIKSAIASL